MTLLALLRHGATVWNEEGRIQGRRDGPLSQRGRAVVIAWRLPRELQGAKWFASPLLRACETARLLGVGAVAVDPRLVEMDWGRWEGRRLTELRETLGPGLAANEARGLDFRPDGGESPRDVQSRLRPWLTEVAAGARTTAAVTHKGVIRAVFALATDWDMTDKPPVRLDWASVHLFTVAGDGKPTVAQLNMSVERA
ncbi:MAG: histidine phosphatase family protein [Alphaproteobacteria bacterium]